MSQEPLSAMHALHQIMQLLKDDGVKFEHEFSSDQLPSEIFHRFTTIMQEVKFLREEATKHSKEEAQVITAVVTIKKKP